MFDDYREIEELDQLEASGMDEAYVEDMTSEERAQARRSAEAALDRRDRENRRRRLGMEVLNEDSEMTGSGSPKPRRRRRVEAAQAGDLADEDYDGLVDVNIDDPRGDLRDWILQDRVRDEIARRFKRFIQQAKNAAGHRIYWEKLNKMVMESRKALEVDFVDLGRAFKRLVIFLVDEPRLMLDIFNEVLLELASLLVTNFAELGYTEAFVRIINVPSDETLRTIRQSHLNTLVGVSGVVVRRTGVFPQLKICMYDCTICGNLLGPFYQNTDAEVKPNTCPRCQSKGPFAMNMNETQYNNYQKLTLQESPGTVPPGMLPRQKEVVLLHDLVDCARPGDEVTVVGIYTHIYDSFLNSKNGFPVFSTKIEANSVVRKDDKCSLFHLTDEDTRYIERMAADTDIGRKIINSIAPSIYGHEFIKTAIALSLFGGREKTKDSHRLRGDINILLLGDPGTAKSQFLKYVEKTAARAVYTTGKGASAVGLTASVHRDVVTREWTLEGGALVLADRGVCLIDEFDKMNDQDRVSIHEAMEQQSISISKAGIVTSLQARCAVVAAANPIGGRYDPSKLFAANVELSDPILSRFDVLCVVRDVVDVFNDERMASFVVGSHADSHPDNADRMDEVCRAAKGMLDDAPHGSQQASDASPAGAPTQDANEDRIPEIIPQEMLKKYVAYAKQRARPALGEMDYNKLVEVYTELRREAGISHGMNMTVRHLESMIRMAEAHATMHLRHRVEPGDLDVGIRMVVSSFIATQKTRVQRDLERKFRKFLVRGRHASSLGWSLLEAMVNEEVAELRLMGVGNMPEWVKLRLRDVERRFRDSNVDIEGFLASQAFARSHYVLDDAEKVIRLHWMRAGDLGGDRPDAPPAIAVH
ncbi:unnamed protein product [Ostreobium quekettii]|uniref:DNA replication licensing factor MCM2 n=1 Tax=Ostreobium quekettii TaxID=121088 RepID=A0A8S1ISZ6_9CHLO|nr:unnamed protein product [Ostreobium quekettii]